MIPDALTQGQYDTVYNFLSLVFAAYHYFRIFDSFKEAFVTDAVGGRGTCTQAEGVSM